MSDTEDTRRPWLNDDSIKARFDRVKTLAELQMRRDGIQPTRFYSEAELSVCGLSRRTLKRLNVAPAVKGSYWGGHVLEALASYRPDRVSTRNHKPTNKTKGSMANGARKSKVERTSGFSLSHLLQPGNGRER